MSAVVAVAVAVPVAVTVAVTVVLPVAVAAAVSVHIGITLQIIRGGHDRRVTKYTTRGTKVFRVQDISPFPLNSP